MKIDKDNGNIIWVNTFEDQEIMTFVTDIRKLKDDKFIAFHSWQRAYSVFTSENQYIGKFTIPYSSSGNPIDFTTNDNGDIFIVGSHTGGFVYDGIERASFGSNCGYGYVLKLDEEFNFQWIIPYHTKCTSIYTLDYDEINNRLLIGGLYKAETEIDTLLNFKVISPYQNEHCI